MFAGQGNFKEGIAHGEEGIRLAEALDHPYSLAFAFWYLAHLQITRGEFSHAVRLLERGLALMSQVEPDLLFSGNHRHPGLRLRALGADCRGRPVAGAAERH